MSLDEWDDPPPVGKRPITSDKISLFPPLMSVQAERPRNYLVEKSQRLEELRNKALDSLNKRSKSSPSVEFSDSSLNVPRVFISSPRPSVEPTTRIVNSSLFGDSTDATISFANSSSISGDSSRMSCDTPGPASAYLPLTVDPKSLLLTTVSKPTPLVPTRMEFARRNNLYYSDDDEVLSDCARYPLGTFPLFGEEMERLATYRNSRRLWWKEPCEFDEASYSYVPSNPPINTDDPYWSYRVCLEDEPPFKNAHQWPRSQARIRVEGPSSGPVRLPKMSGRVPPQVALDWEDYPRLRRRKSTEIGKLGTTRAASLYETKSRSESKPKCQTNVNIRPKLSYLFPP